MQDDHSKASCEQNLA